METINIDMKKLSRINYLKHYIGKDCIVVNPSNLMSGIIEQLDVEDDSVLIQSGEKSTWVEAEYVKPRCKSFSDIDNEDLEIIVNNIVVNNVIQSFENFTVSQRTNHFIMLHSEKFNISIKSNWGILCTGVEGSIASPIDNTGQIIMLLCEMNYDVTGMF